MVNGIISGWTSFLSLFGEEDECRGYSDSSGEIVKERKNLIAVVSKSDATGGGASRVAERLCDLLRKTGNPVDHWVGYSKRLRSADFQFLAGGLATTMVWKACSYFSRVLGYTDVFTPEWIMLKLKRFDRRYDLAHLHDTSRTLSPWTIKKIAERMPVIWTIHDCSPFTGGCLYPMDCNHFETGCHDCKKIGEWPLSTRFDRTGEIQQLKRSLIRHAQIQPVTPSRWMAGELARSGVFSRPAVVIPNFVSTDIYAPSEHALASRNEYNVPDKIFAICISAGALDDDRKGIEQAIITLESWSRKFHLVLMGRISPDLSERISSINHTAVGYVSDESEMARVYAMCDVFLFTSLADNLPNVILESMACATPVLAFATGGVPEMISHKEDGWLTEPMNTDGLVQGLELVFHDRDLLADWSRMARQKVLEHFNEDLFLRRHLELYRSSLDRIQSSAALP